MAAADDDDVKDHRDDHSPTKTNDKPESADNEEAVMIKDRDEDSGKENNTSSTKISNRGALPSASHEEVEKDPELSSISHDNEIRNSTLPEKGDEIESNVQHDDERPSREEDDDETASSGDRSLNDMMAGGHIVFPDSFTLNDDKSEGTRPDPPSTMDGRDAAEILGDELLGGDRTDEYDYFDPATHLLVTKREHAVDASPIITISRKKEIVDDAALRASRQESADETPNADGQTMPHQSPRSGLQTYGADNLALLPPVDEDRFYGHDPRLAYQSPLPPQTNQQSFHSLPDGVPSNNSGRRKIRFRLSEEVLVKRTHKRTSSLLGTLRKSSTRMLRFGGKHEEESYLGPLYKTVDRGSITVSWYNGTSSLELQQHVRRSVVRQLKVENPSAELDDFRILDESTDPPEEIVLSPFIPDGSSFMLFFSLLNEGECKKSGMETPSSQYSIRPPVSPSAAPSPHPSDHLRNLNASQLELLSSFKPKKKKRENENTRSISTLPSEDKNDTQFDSAPADRAEVVEEDATETGEAGGTIDARLEEIRELLLDGKSPKTPHRGSAARRQEKQQVVFVVANYFVLFLALIALSAEMQARAPNWMKMMENHVKNVRNCSENQEALFECVSRGDFAGLIASVGLWLSRSVTTRRIFLFGFDTPKKLWTVVYESLVSSICWGISYVFIRRGMNPDTRHRFIQKYWKDAVYGSLAGFNATFLKMVLKNLVPQDAVEDAFKERQLKFLSWLPSFR